jgi:ketosteroid isomerase-like protein
MSEENVQLTTAALDAFNRCDLEAYLDLLDPDVAFSPYEVWAQGAEPHRGHAAVRTWWEAAFGALPDLRAEVDEIRDLGDWTFVRGWIGGEVEASGLPIERPMWLVVEWRDQQAIGWCSCSSEAEALEAAGLQR